MFVGVGWLTEQALIRRYELLAKGWEFGWDQLAVGEGICIRKIGWHASKTQLIVEKVSVIADPRAQLPWEVISKGAVMVGKGARAPNSGEDLVEE